MTKYLPTVHLEGEIVTQPARTTVTRIFYERVALKLSPFIVGALLLMHNGAGLISGLLTLVILFVIVSVFVPKIAPIGALGGGLTRTIGSLLSAGSDILDGVIGPNKGQVPVVILNLQTTHRPTPITTSKDLVTKPCINSACRYENTSDAQHCLSCGTKLNKVESTSNQGIGPQRFSVRIEGQIVGGEPTIGHHVSIDAFNNRGNLLFIAGRDNTTGADIIVKRNADTGKQH